MTIPTEGRRRRLFAWIGAGVAAAVLIAGAIVAVDLMGLATGIHRSHVAMPSGTSQPGVPQLTGETNILVMGLDSRVDENGDPYPADIYNAIHAEDQSVGGYNTNVLMFIHIPAGGGQAVGISIPRDDYVQYAGTPGGAGHGKIKEAYGREFAAQYSALLNKGVAKTDAYQQARTAARQEEIDTVSTFLGGVRIDHFVEITMAAFYRIAQAVQPVTVCLNHATADTFSGADFPAGVQQVSASQAMAFVRQRRDTRYKNVFLTDLDRTRRQQAFIVSLAVKLRHSGTFANPVTMQTLIDTAKQYVALDSGFDLLSLASQAQRLSGGGLSFQTLPIERYGTVGGEDVNIVDVAKIQAIVAGLLHPPTPTPAPTPSSQTTTKATPPATPSPTSTTPGSNVYTDSRSPLQSGVVPCVN
ncbi:LCP family protein [Microbacterium rhizosphaerae]|uniref:LCP family protein n=1 Tax=Microbacterium rhizosphaerae TaxID=1678237 RepID=A0ABZ0SJT2_9MICO|nr:LCP family protein [Microbacterium rhizosphaerae]WPR88873.1 LCP family protein [Microbacterium rhizosphaerae]